MSRSSDSRRPSIRRRVTMRPRANLLAMRPYVEQLEPLLLLSTVTVTNAGDTAAIGSGSLRAAILELDAGTGGEIDFSIGSGLVTIQPLSRLPDITKPIFVNGASQPGFNATTRQPIVQVDGTKVADPTDAYGFLLGAGSSGSRISGLIISRFAGDGLGITGSNSNVIVGNFIGTDPTGNNPAGNRNGVVVSGGASNNTIGGFVGNNLRNQLISGNTGAGIVITGAGTDGNVVSYTDVGTNGFNAPVPNRFDGIDIDGADGTSVFNATIAYNGHHDLNTSILYGEGIQLQGSSNTSLQGNLSTTTCSAASTSSASSSPSRSRTSTRPARSSTAA